MPITACRYFSGYKPCGLNAKCDASCGQKDIPRSRLLVVHLGALGAVLRSTALLKSIKRKFPGSHITWVTKAPGDQLLANNPLVDQVLCYDFSGLTQLKAQAFDAVFCIDKSLEATGLLTDIRHDLLFGFKNELDGSIVPATPHAQELWEIGLSNRKKFFENTKSELQLVTEALDLSYERDPYLISLTSEEVAEMKLRRSNWLDGKEALIGINIGCSNVIPYKKMSIGGHRKLISALEKTFKKANIILLGGAEDAISAMRIAKGLDVTVSPMDRGLRDGLLSVGACDVIVSGDSLGMHMAIALKKWTVAWFGPTCSQEIELYGNGEKILSGAECGPCWKRSCRKETMCYDLVKTKDILAGIQKGLLRRKESRLPKRVQSPRL